MKAVVIIMMEEIAIKEGEIITLPHNNQITQQIQTIKIHFKIVAINRMNRLKLIFKLSKITLITKADMTAIFIIEMNYFKTRVKLRKYLTRLLNKK